MVACEKRAQTQIKRNETGDALELNNLTRRSALRLLLGAGLATLAPHAALAVDQSDVDATNSQIDANEKQVQKVQAELDDIAAQYESLSKKQSDTLDQIETTQDKIDSVEKSIDKKEKELKTKRERLAKRMSADYQSGSTSALDVLFSSSTFEEFESKVYYMDKISESDSKMIQEVKGLKEDLESQRDTLSAQKAQLETLSATQKQQLKEMESKQQETQKILSDLNDQQKQLMAQRDSELEAMAKEKAEQAAAAKAAAAAARASSGAAASNVTGTISDGGATTGSQQAVVNACHSTPSPGLGLCAMWVSQVFNNAGLGYASGNACDMYNAWCTSSNRGDLKPGMIVAVSSHSHTAAGRIYGHIGIYVGGGVMMDNVGYIRTINVNEWISYYGTTVTPRWGWLMGIKLA